jgi:hypothetical protein
VDQSASSFAFAGRYKWIILSFLVAKANFAIVLAGFNCLIMGNFVGAYFKDSIGFLEVVRIP